MSVCHTLSGWLLFCIAIGGILGNITAVIGQFVFPIFSFDFFFSVLRIMGSRRSASFLSVFQPYLTILALVDTFLILMYLLDNVFIDHIDMSNTYWYYTVVPYITHPIKNISITMSMLWVVVIAIERFLAVTQPLINRDKESVHSYAVFLVVFSVTVNFSK